MEPGSITLGTRGSQLALWQATRIQEQLEAAGWQVTVETITTRGDQVQDVPLSEVGDEALFTKELDRAMLREEIDVAVHSLKDLPTRLPVGIVLAAVSERANPFDAFIAHPSFDGDLADLPEGAVIATSSLRRRAQLKAWRPDLEIVPVRGNVDSRIDKLDASDWHAMVLAVAGLVRMGMRDRIRQAFPVEIMIPAVGQGALGITCRAEEGALRERLQHTLNHQSTHIAIRAERAFMREIGGGCQVPTGAWARLNESGAVVLDGCVAALDGSALYRDRRVVVPENAAQAGRSLATQLLDTGGAAILDAIREHPHS